MANKSTSASSAASPTSNSTETNYAAGLAGVNLELDQKLTRYLFGTILAVVAFILLMRVYHLYHSHIRRVSCVGATNREQGYWSYNKNWWHPWMKREIIYAPLGNKRHNREWQLGKATNYGTLPGRVHTILLSLYVLSNVVYCSILPYKQHNVAATIAELRGRCGMLSVVNMLALILFAGRNNPLISLLKISFDTFNLFHRWIGRVVILEAFVHVIAWYVNYMAEDNGNGHRDQHAALLFLGSGFVAMIAMAIIMLQTLSPLRHAFYEFFLHAHQVLAVFAFAGIYVHLNVESLPALPFIRMVILSWIIERIIRVIRIIYLNVHLRRREVTNVIIEALPGEACRVTFQLPRATTIRPGSHVYAYLPRFSYWMSHPFSVAWTNPESEPPTGPMIMHTSADDIDTDTLATISDPKTAAPLKSPNYLERQSASDHLASWRYRGGKPPTSLSLITAARTGMTRQIYEAASKAPNRTLFTSGFVEGPYAGHDDLASYGTIVMFAGGAGITHHLVQIRHLIAAANARTVATRKIVLAWSVRDLEALTWVAPWMDEILKMPGRKEILSMRLFVTKPRGKSDFVSPSKSILLKGERCNPGKVLDEVMWGGRQIGATFVSVCGPGAFADEVRGAVRERVDLGVLEMNEESFTW